MCGCQAFGGRGLPDCGDHAGCAQRRLAAPARQSLARPQTQTNFTTIAMYFTSAFAGVMTRHRDAVVGLRQKGLVMEAEFAGAQGAVFARMRAVMAKA